MQALPLSIAAWFEFRLRKKVLEHSLPQSKRKALLQHRGLFDFVSPFLVLLAVLSYFLFGAFLLYLDRHPFPGFAGALTNIVGITLVYLMEAFAVYWMLYGKKINPLETSAESQRRRGLVMNLCIGACIAVIVALSLNFMLVLRDLQKWEPFAQSAFFVVTMLFCLMVTTAPRRQPESDALSTNTAS